MDKGTQTGAGGQKNAFTQCTTGAKVESGTQVEPPKRGDKGLQTVGLQGGPVLLAGKVVKIEILKGDAKI